MGRITEIAAAAEVASPLMGHNNPPAPSPLDAFTAHISDLMETAQGFLDGEPVLTQDLANSVSKVMDECRKTAKDADAARAAEKKIHDDAAKAVQAQWKPLLERCDLAVQACKAALRPYLEAQEEEKRRAARIAQEAAEAARRAAEEAAKAAQPSDLAARESAEALNKAAKVAQKGANAAAKGRGRATGGARATTLRTVWRAELIDRKEAVRHFWTVNPEAFEPLLHQLAGDEVQAGKRAVPGFSIIEDKVVV